MLAGQLEIQLLTNMARLSNDMDKAQRTVSGAMQKVERAVGRAQAVLGALGLGLGLREIAHYADAWAGASNQLRIVATDTKNLAALQTGLIKVSNDTRSSFESTATLYSRLSRSTEKLNLTQNELMGITTTINKAFVSTGATAQEASSAIIQLSQGLAAGALRGDEFRSVAEQAPALMKAIADSLNMTIGELRTFAYDGKLSTETVVKALQDGAADIDATFNKSVITLGQSLTVAKNNLMEFIGGSQLVSGGMTAAGESIISLTKHLDILAEAGKALAVLYVARLTPAILANVVATRAAILENIRYQATLASMAGLSAKAAASQTALAVASSGLNKSLALIGGPAGIAVIAAYAFYELGKSLETLEEKHKKVTDAIDEQRKALNDLTIQETARAVQATFEQIKALEKSIEIYESDIYGNYTKQTEIARGELEELNQLHAEQIERLLELRKATAAQTEEITEQSNALWLLNNAYSTNNVTAASYVAQMEASGAVFNDVIEAVNELEDDTVDLRYTTSEATEAMIRDWQNVRQSFAEFFADLVLEGGNAFDALLKSWERTALQMAGNSLFDIGASLFGFNVPGGATSRTSGTGLAAFAGIPGISEFFAGATGSLVSGAGSIGAFNATSGMWQAPSMMAPGAGGGASGFLSGAGNILGKAMPWVAGAMILWEMFGKKSTPSFNAGMLLKELPGISGQFGVDPFASGLAPVGFSRRTSTAESNQVIGTFRIADQSFVDLVNALGGSVNANQGTFTGLSETGTGSGIFFGAAGEKGRPGMDLLQQVDLYLRQLTGAVDGLDDELMGLLRAARTGEEVMTILSNAVAENAVEASAAANAIDTATQAYSDLSSTLVDSLREIRGEQERLIESQMRAVRDYWTELHRRQTNLFDSLQSYTRSLRLGDMSGLSPREQLSFAETEFNTLAGTALNTSLGMDQRLAAAEKLQGAAEDYLREYRETNASAGYGSVFDTVMQTLEAAKFLGTNQPFEGSSIENAMLKELQTLNAQVGMLPPGIASQLAPIISGFIFQAKAAGISDKVTANTIRSQGAEVAAAADQSGLFPGFVSANATPEAAIVAYVRAQRDAHGIGRTALMNIRSKATSLGISADYIGSLLGYGPAETQKALQMFGVDSFASGGYHSGGWSMVGERGPELRYTSGPSMTVSNSDSMGIAASNSKMTSLLESIDRRLVTLERVNSSGYQFLGNKHDQQIAAIEDTGKHPEVVGSASSGR